nr:MAG TPA_asm: Polysaccharide biosynthesis/export protein [Caudoviricetes sp.]
MTRGDSECLEVTISGYELQPGDKLEMTVRPYVGGKILLHKEITEFEQEYTV